MDMWDALTALPSKQTKMPFQGPWNLTMNGGKYGRGQMNGRRMGGGHHH